MMRRAGSVGVQSGFEKQTRENMDLKMYRKSTKMAENECRKAWLGEKQRRAFRAQHLGLRVQADSSSNKSNKARAVPKLQREKDELIAISDS